MPTFWREFTTQSGTKVQVFWADEPNPLGRPEPHLVRLAIQILKRKAAAQLEDSSADANNKAAGGEKA